MSTRLTLRAPFLDQMGAENDLLGMGDMLYRRRAPAPPMLAWHEFMSVTKFYRGRIPPEEGNPTISTAFSADRDSGDGMSNLSMATMWKRIAA